MTELMTPKYITLDLGHEKILCYGQDLKQIILKTHFVITA
jgi:hypothetical protein